MGRGRLIITCEHAGNEIPPSYRFVFKGKENVLESHLGWDPGAYPIAKAISENLKVRLYSQKYSRLLIENNRSLENTELFSKYTSRLNLIIKNHLIKKYYKTYRGKIENSIKKSVQSGAHVIHLSIHTFTPSLKGITRKADIGLLFDPSRESESRFCNSLKRELNQMDSALVVKFNYPYLGVDDGLTSYLRKKWSDQNYSGIEIEVNQIYARWPKRKKVQNLLLKCIRKVYFDYYNK